MHSTAATAALDLSELEARASAVDSMLGLVRVEIERNVALAGVFAYNSLGRYQLKRLKVALDAHWDELRDEQLQELATRLERVPELLGPALRDAERTVSAMRVMEKYALVSVRGSLIRVEALIGELRAEAGKASRPQLSIGTPQLCVPMRRQAVMASALLRPVNPDPAERHPDPDYGL